MLPRPLRSLPRRERPGCAASPRTAFSSAHVPASHAILGSHHPVTAAPNVLELRNVAKDYEGNRVLKGVSLTVGAGSIHALVGENGAGKSTLMNVLFGMPVIRE